MTAFVVVETVLGVPLDGISGPESWTEAGIFAGVLTVSGLVLWWRIGHGNGDDDTISNAYARTHAWIIGMLHLGILACGGPSPDHEER